MSRTEKFDLHQEITNNIIASLETAGDCTLPWIKSANLGMPINVASKKAYRGTNVLNLWITSFANKFTSNIWGTYRQWQAAGCQVRKGEKSSIVVFYKSIQIDDDSDSEDAGNRLMARASRVFNAAQVEGYEAEQEIPEAPLFERIERADNLVEASGANLIIGGEQACFHPKTDEVHMPDLERFIGTETSSPEEGFYSTLFHELTHWSGSKSRLDRDLSGRFGSASYAMEELVAELGAAFICCALGLTLQPRKDHAAYIKNWLQALKNDKKAIFTAASKASQAASWLMAFDQIEQQQEAA